MRGSPGLSATAGAEVCFLKLTVMLGSVGLPLVVVASITSPFHPRIDDGSAYGYLLLASVLIAAAAGGVSRSSLRRARVTASAFAILSTVGLVLVVVNPRHTWEFYRSMTWMTALNGLFIASAFLAVTAYAVYWVMSRSKSGKTFGQRIRTESIATGGGWLDRTARVLCSIGALPSFLLLLLIAGYVLFLADDAKGLLPVGLLFAVLATLVLVGGVLTAAPALVCSSPPRALLRFGRVIVVMAAVAGFFVGSFPIDGEPDSYREDLEHLPDGVVAFLRAVLDVAAWCALIGLLMWLLSWAFDRRRDRDRSEGGAKA